MQGREKIRRPTKPYYRATAWIRETENATWKTHTDTKPVNIVAYTVRRALLTSTADGIFEHTDLLDFLESDHGAKPVRKHSLSLIAPQEAKRIASRWSGEREILRQKLQVTKVLPRLLAGSLCHPIIFGVQPDQAGPRFIGYTLNHRLQSVIHAERDRLFTELGETHSPDYPFIPHLTLLETSDQELAESLRQKLGSFVSGPPIPVEFGQAVTIPIMNKPWDQLKLSGV